MSSSATSRHAHERSRSNIDIDSTTAGEVDTQNDPTEGDLPMSMMASVILTNLPKDASQALKDVEEIDNFKVPVRFQPIGGAPIMKQKVFTIKASSRFSVVVNFLRKKIRIGDGDGLFLYVNSVFAPGLDEGVGNLYRGFKVDDQLIVSYSTMPAFG